MRYFVTDKTITLHDLANNGLLQLDQIRSYNPLTIFSNHSSDDNNDQKKEYEEDFLDEIDTSSRRLSNKSSEPTPTSKRLTDTSLSTKQTTILKSPKLTKTYSDDYEQKSIVSSDINDELKDKKISLTKQQRRQTVTGTTLSSRSSNQSASKKSSKCKFFFLILFLFQHF
jgi:hypothetical protein